MEGILSKTQSKCAKICALVLNRPASKQPTRAEELIAALHETKQKLAALEPALDLETYFDRFDAFVF